MVASTGLRYRNVHESEVSAQPWTLVQCSWQRVLEALTGPLEGKQLLVIVDAYSK